VAQSSDDRATANTGLDLMYVRTKLSGPSGAVVQLLSVVAESSTSVRVAWNVRRHRRYMQGFHVRWRQASARRRQVKPGWLNGVAGRICESGPRFPPHEQKIFCQKFFYYYNFLWSGKTMGGAVFHPLARAPLLQSIKHSLHKFLFCQEKGLPLLLHFLLE